MPPLWQIRALVDRAAACSKPFNVQDAAMILKALNTLRYRSSSVRTICEKAAFAIASSRITVPVERVVDSLNALVSLQAAPLPIVHSVLVKRLLELNQNTGTSPSMQKAALVIVRLGKTYADVSVANHLFAVIREQVENQQRDDYVLRLALIALYQYTSFAPAPRAGSAANAETTESDGSAPLQFDDDTSNTDAEQTPKQQNQDHQSRHASPPVNPPSPQRRREAQAAVEKAAIALVRGNHVASLLGNNTLQALHLFPFFSHVPPNSSSASATATNGSSDSAGSVGGNSSSSVSSKNSSDIATSDEVGSARAAFRKTGRGVVNPREPNDDDGPDGLVAVDPREWDDVVYAFRKEIRIFSVVPGGFAQFLRDMLPVMSTQDRFSCDLIAQLLAGLYHRDFAKALNSYDVSKIAATICAVPMERWIRLRASPVVTRDSSPPASATGGIQTIDNNRKNPLDRLNEVIAQIVLSFIDQLEFFSRSIRADRIDGVAVGSVWHLVQRYATALGENAEVAPHNAEMQEAIRKLIATTEGALTMMNVRVLSWTLLSCSKLARTPFGSPTFTPFLEKTLQCIHAGKGNLTIHQSVQCLYAVSILMVPSPQERLKLQRTSTPVRMREILKERQKTWKPNHPAVTFLISALAPHKFRSYPAEDIPVALDALANIAEASARDNVKLPDVVVAAIDPMLTHLSARDNARYYRRFSVELTCTMIAFVELIPDNEMLIFTLKMFLLDLQSRTLTLPSMTKLIESVIAQRRRKVVSFIALWVRERVVDMVLSVSYKTVTLQPSQTTRMWDLLHFAEAAQELGATLHFDVRNSAASDFHGRQLPINLDAFLFQPAGAGGHKPQRMRGMSGPDAAHALRLMSQEIKVHGQVAVSARTLQELRNIALRRKRLSTSTIIALLKANATQTTSRALFSDEDAHLLLTITLDYLAINYDAIEKGLIVRFYLRESGKVLFALLSSHLLTRAGLTVASLEREHRKAVENLSRMLIDSQTLSNDNRLRLELWCEPLVPYVDKPNDNRKE